MAIIRMNFLSRALGLQTNVTICLPSFSGRDRQEGREKVYVPGMKYQVLWLLHGGSGDDSDYLHFSNIARYAENNKLAVVMPSGYNSNYMDTDTAKYMRFVAEELPELCRAYFPFSDRREDNFIGGLSMGSNGAQKVAVRYPENYAAVLAMSAGSFDEGRDASKRTWTPPRMPMPPHKPDEMAENCAILKKAIADGKQLPDFYMIWGEKDFVRDGAIRSAQFLKDQGCTVYTEEVPGLGHEWELWDRTLEKALDQLLPLKHDLVD